MTLDRDATHDASSSASHHMWGGRFGTPPDEALAALNDSLPVDRRLWMQDIRGSKAWVTALHEASVLDPDERTALHEGLDRVGERLAAGGEIDATDEDIHTLVERLLYEEVGDVAGKLHTGRSRNDQVVTDLRLWCLDAIEALDEQVAALGMALVGQGRDGVDMLLPGYTHGQQAQPVRWAYVMAAHAWPLLRDRERLGEIAGRVAVLPLGSGALAGSGVAVDRERLCELLGFRAISQNALDATGDRDFVAEMLFAATLLATHVSRLGGELVTYSSTEYGFVRLSDAFSTGSSLLPQKRNPDVFELARAKASRTLGDLVAMLGTMRGLPAGYSKDLQEDKTLLFDAVDTMLVTLPAVRGAVATMEPVPDRMRSVLRDTLMATDVADELVNAGIPFRKAHGLTGRLVREAEALGVPLREVPSEHTKQIHEGLPDILERLGSFEDSVERRRTVGGTSKASVEAQLDALEQFFSN